MASKPVCSSACGTDLIKPKCEVVNLKQLELHAVQRNKSTNRKFITKLDRELSFSEDTEDKDSLVDAGLYCNNNELCCYSCDVKVKLEECNKPFDVHHDTCLHIKIKQMDGCERKDHSLRLHPDVHHECLKCKTKWRVILYLSCGHLVLCTDCFLEELHSGSELENDSAAQDNSLPEASISSLPLNYTAESANFVVCPLVNCKKQSSYFKKVIRK